MQVTTTVRQISNEAFRKAPGLSLRVQTLLAATLLTGAINLMTGTEAMAADLRPVAAPVQPVALKPILASASLQELEPRRHLALAPLREGQPARTASAATAAGLPRLVVPGLAKAPLRNLDAPVRLAASGENDETLSTGSVSAPEAPKTPVTAPVESVPAHPDPAALVADAPHRFALSAVEGGLARLDLEKGTLDICRPAEDLWRCVPVPEARQAYESEIATLSAEITELKAQVQRLEGSEQVPQPKAGPGAAAPESEDPAEIERMMQFSDTLMRRFFGLIQDMQKELGQNGG
ncbi:hypothetical protein [Roseibium aestuarii]|uniref:LTXXQ motif family protein n=1 Tax=Roseibium aestuarii TaxID=2600299 RepID=A0ABW4JSK8_9HYPH|nr:hypothetical protein [Roseibium aestuarii]